MSKEEELPDLDFGQPLGACLGVVAYSNLDDYYFSGEQAYCQGVFTGYKYQCVEYARRMMLIRTGCIFGQCGPAHEIFDMTEVTNVVTGGTHKFVACKNGETDVKPVCGMTLVYPIDKKMPVGHVAVISEVGEDWVGIAEENEASKNWQGKPYGRKVKLVHDAEKNTWRMDETDPHFVPCRGWLYIDGVEAVAPKEDVPAEMLNTVCPRTLSEDIYPKWNIHKDHITPPSPPKKLARFTTPVIKPKEHKFDGDETRRRVVLQKEYNELLAGGAKGIQAHGVPNAPHHEEDPSSPRVAVRRFPHYQSVYSPNQELGVASIGQAMRAFKVVERFAMDTITPAAKDEAVAKDLSAKYNIPLNLVQAAARQLAASQGASCALATADVAMGTMGLVFDPTDDKYRLAHGELDSLAFTIDINAFQDTYAVDAGLERGWRLTTFGNDFHRCIRNFLKFRVHNHKADSTLHFLKFGTAAELKARFPNLTLSDADVYHYELERVQSEYLAETLKEFLSEKKKDFENGDLSEDDLPKWSVELVDFFGDDVTIGQSNATLKVGSVESQFVFKTTPWSLLFKISASTSDAKLNEFLNVVCAKETQQVVFQPLWTHFTGQKRFLFDIATWAEKSGVTLDDVGAATDFTIPTKYWPNGADGECTYKVQALEGLVNPPIMGNPYTEKEVEGTPEEGSPNRAKYAFPIFHMLMVGGKRSAGFFLEARSDVVNEGNALHNAVHPGPLVYMPWAVKGEEEEKNEEEEKEDEKSKL